MHSKYMFKAFSKLHIVLHNVGGNEASGMRRTQMPYWKSKRDELGGSGMGHYIIAEWWSQGGIKMFQTNITLPCTQLDDALHCAAVRACLPELLSKWVENRARVTFMGVSAVWVGRVGWLSLWLQSVIVSGDCGSVSAAPLLLPSLFCLSSLSWVQLNTCSLPCAQGRAGFPKQLRAT